MYVPLLLSPALRCSSRIRSHPIFCYHVMFGPGTLKLAPDPVSLLFVSIKNINAKGSISIAAPPPVN
uniref:Uncharacterized protein n=1 Tax=Arundo donax TaxID=35708 RepID=A0A0A9EGW8_ARUDO